MKRREPAWQSRSRTSEYLAQRAKAAKDCEKSGLRLEFDSSKFEIVSDFGAPVKTGKCCE
jgi:hypothetical protein